MHQATIGLKILYADDSDDCFFLSESISSSGFPADLIYVSEAAEAINYLETTHDKEKLPSLIIRNVNIPMLDAKQILTYIKVHPFFSAISVVILATAENKKDKDYCTQKGAISYLKNQPI